MSLPTTKANPAPEEPPLKKPKLCVKAGPNGHVLLNVPEIWVENIFPFLGPGHFVFVAGVCKDMKKHHETYFNTLDAKQRGTVKTPWPRVGSESRRRGPLYAPTPVTATFWSAVFSSVPRTKHWAKLSNNENGHQKIPSFCGKLAFKDRLVCTLIAYHGNLEVLKWARGNHLPWDESTCSMAALLGNLEVMKWAHENGCSWDSTTCIAACHGGHLKCLEYAHKHGCHWSDENHGQASTAYRNGQYSQCIAYFKRPDRTMAALLALCFRPE